MSTNTYPALPAMTEIEIIEALAEDDEFFRFYPRFDVYSAEWLRMGGAEAAAVPQHVIFEFYAEKLMVEEALHIWFTYDPVTQLEMCK